MNKPLPLVGIACDVTQYGLHSAHTVGEKYIHALAHGTQAMPFLIPAFGDGKDIRDLSSLYSVEDIVSRLDGLFLPGSPSNIQPQNYAGQAHEQGTLEDPQRDSLTLQLIRCCIEQAVPILALCRGFQELNVALGGTLHTRVQDIDGYHDHREDKSKDREAQYDPAHTVEFTPGGLIHRLTNESSWQVNSLHSQGIDRLADSLAIEAVADDGLIEAASYRSTEGNKDAWALGVQWHPEWQYESNKVSVALFNAFGQKIRRK